MSAPAAAPAAEAAPKKGGKKMVLVAVCLVFAGAGAAFPMIVNVPALMNKSKDDAAAAKKEKKDAKTAIVPFGDITVNLSEERPARYLRLKAAFLVDAEAEKEVTAEVTKKKAAVKSALIAHLAGKTVKDVSGASGVTRTQRELLEKVEDVLYPDGNSKIKSVLFEEYVIQ